MQKIIKEYYCDLCKTKCEEVKKINVPVYQDTYAYEWGIKPTTPTYETKEMELCHHFLDKVTVIKELPVFYGESEYKFRQLNAKSDNKED